MKTTEKVIVGVLAGAAAGAILGILFAPNKGSETRRKISKTSSDTVNDVKSKIAHLLDGMADKFESAKEEIASDYGRVKNKIEEFSKDVKIV